MIIYFYHTREKYGCFSNFSAHGFELDGLYWSTSEHYFQAQKFPATADAEQIRFAKTPIISSENGT
jgi:ribA/ribD-fused uncharacterized protein